MNQVASGGSSNSSQFKPNPFYIGGGAVVKAISGAKSAISAANITNQSNQNLASRTVLPGTDIPARVKAPDITKATVQGGIKGGAIGLVANLAKTYYEQKLQPAFNQGGFSAAANQVKNDYVNAAKPIEVLRYNLIAIPSAISGLFKR